MDLSTLRPFDKSYYQSEDLLELAQDLLGQFLITNIDKHICVGKIVETEAYRAPDDKGSHAYNNKKTNRTAVMFREGGCSYIYLCYGIHQMFNVVSGPKETAHAILVRALEPIAGLEVMSLRRKKAKGINLANGPGKLCQAMGISRIHNGNDLTDQRQSIWLAKNDKKKQLKIIASPRVGIAYADECARYPWRYRIKNHLYTSLPQNVNYD